MNILQGLDAPVEFLVSLNPPRWLDERHVIRELDYEHPVYTPEGVAARERLPAIQGARRTFFCGAWCGYGFHEDGVQAGLAAARAVHDWSRHAELPLRRAG
jgi:predicted NAD/FAD-binding protein